LRWRPLEVPAVNNNDVRGFVHGWFAAFERLQPAEFFLDHFDPDFVFGDHRTPDEFRGWYAGWQVHCPWDHHEDLDLTVAGSAGTGWRVDVLLRLVGEWLDDAARRTEKPASLLDRYIRQTWALRVFTVPTSALLPLGWSASTTRACCQSAGQGRSASGKSLHRGGLP
jgi:hypothetical protein